MRRALLTLLWCVIGGAVAVPAAAAEPEPENADIRVLIDISGSMKQNDPQNLRRPAMRMLVGLLQPGTKAGVWTFAQYAAELVQPGPVDEAWKRRALAASEKINSPGLFTNIELVMRRAIREWEGAPITHRRNLLLLTDGVVDVSKTPGESAASRRRILEELLPQIRGMGTQIHTIALSSRADHELLEKLAKDTGGWYQQVESAEQLQRVFLKLFEKAGRPEGLPLKGNKFRVDNTIREATVLVFRSADAEPTRLTSPSGETFGRESAPPFVNWHEDTGYELITIRDPEAGEWAVTAAMDPDNRVMVVTDLKLRVSELPTRIAVGDALRVSAHLANDGRVITRRDFLELVEMRSETVTDVGLAPQPLNDKGYKGDQQAGDGQFSMDFVERQAHRELNLVIAAESPTFLREHRHLMAVLEPATLTIEKSTQGVPTAVLTLEGAVMRLADARFGAWQETEDGTKQKLALTPRGRGHYVAELLDPALPVYARVEGVSELGNALNRRYGPVYVPGMEPAPPVTPEPAAAKEPAVQAERQAAEPVAQAEPEAPAEKQAETPAAESAPPPEPPEEESPGWLLPTIAFGAVNLLLIAGGVFWWLRRRARGDDEIDLLDAEDAGEQPGDEAQAAEKS